MTPEQLQKLPLAARAAALEVGLDWILQILDMQLHIAGQETRTQTLTAAKKKLQHAQSDYAQIYDNEMSPEESDAFSAELQDAFERVSQKILRAIEGG